MAKNSVRDFDATAANNTDIQSVNIAEGCAPSGINNAIRELMADMKDVSAGTIALESPQADSMTVTGDLTVDTNTLFVDASANAVGIGTSTVSEVLHLHRASGSCAMKITDSTTGTGTSDGFEIGKDTSQRGFIWNYENADTYFATNNSERMRIDSSGNVGIGESSPATRLEVKDTRPTLRLTSSYNGTWTSGDDIARLSFFTDDSSGIGAHETGFIFNETEQGGTSMSGALVFGTAAYNTAATERMRIDSSGRLMMGTTSTAPNNGGTTINGSFGLMYLSRSGTNQTSQVVFNRNSSTVGTIGTNGTSTTYNTSSDYRLKENIIDAPSSSSDIDAIQVRSFDWKVDGSHQKYGMIAQELLTVAPEAVSQPEDSEEMMGVDYSKLVPMLVKEIQSLRQRITDLENA